MEMEKGTFEVCQMRVGQMFKTQSHPALQFTRMEWQVWLEGLEQVAARQKGKIQREEEAFCKGLSNARDGIFWE